MRFNIQPFNFFDDLRVCIEVGSMATAFAHRDIFPRNQAYLSLLAGRAVTSLVQLAGNPSIWNDRVERGLRDGIRYCQVIRAHRGEGVRGDDSSARTPLRRSVEASNSASASMDVSTDSRRVESFLTEMLSRKRHPELPELVDAIEFLRKAATEP